MRLTIIFHIIITPFSTSGRRFAPCAGPDLVRPSYTPYAAPRRNARRATESWSSGKISSDYASSWDALRAPIAAPRQLTAGPPFRPSTIRSLPYWLFCLHTNRNILDLRDSFGSWAALVGLTRISKNARGPDGWGKGPRFFRLREGLGRLGAGLGLC